MTLDGWRAASQHSVAVTKKNRPSGTTGGDRGLIGVLMVDSLSPCLACAITSCRTRSWTSKADRCVPTVRLRQWGTQPVTPLSCSIRSFAFEKPYTNLRPLVVEKTNWPALNLGSAYGRSPASDASRSSCTRAPSIRRAGTVQSRLVAPRPGDVGDLPHPLSGQCTALPLRPALRSSHLVAAFHCAALWWHRGRGQGDAS